MRESQKKQQQTLILLAATTLLNVTAVALAQPNKVCTTPCGCKSRVIKRLEVYTTQFERALGQHQANLLDFSKLILAAVAADNQLKRKAAAALAPAAAILARCTDQLNAAAPPLTAAAYQAGYTAATYAAQHALTTMAGTLKIEPTGGKTLKAETITTKTLGSIPPAMCPTEDQTETGVKITTESEKDEPKLATIKLHSNAQAKCTATGANSCHDNALADSGNLEIQLTYAMGQKKTPWTWNSNTNADFQTTHSAEINLLRGNESDLDSKLTTLRTAHALDSCRKAIAEYSALSSDPNWALFNAKALLDNFESEKPSDISSDRLEQATNKAYGPDGTNYKNNVWHKIEQTQVPTVQHEQLKLQPIKSLSSTDEIGAALARVFINQQKKETQTHQKQGQKDDDTKENECSNKNGDKCKGDCVLDGDICKPKKKGEDENKEKDGKTASTCAGKDEKTCGTTQGCSWENNACKDFSILLTKQFALSMVSAAFVAFLF
ncbi:variant surface glycoprotein (VSG, atypical), putative [Trypanosoma brucei brucei TREU927]|uniref:Variant surface glycoprotein (VSG, atypical), putative n=1 Tax=Trypanosoma brucei brucei (strain 927/4 GUTat10.1) TaxID=185431 RepID=Q57XI7_TRYB2|nr:variant surface glycoprotein (VSG, atypical), putative [Trypanosoma brucei brucei TREU927]AAX69688.1 variant surface glycoprotein (VSG, atypical), putative [Trypanosoma brucei]AAZ12818.1 variant surface glycoprotein (VSG, atypical), putative [Trypanosoma brucei brucei TREU927]